MNEKQHNKFGYQAKVGMIRQHWWDNSLPPQILKG